MWTPHSSLFLKHSKTILTHYIRYYLISFRAHVPDLSEDLAVPTPTTFYICSLSLSYPLLPTYYSVPFYPPNIPPTLYPSHHSSCIFHPLTLVHFLLTLSISLPIFCLSSGDNSGKLHRSLALLLTNSNASFLFGISSRRSCETVQ